MDVTLNFMGLLKGYIGTESVSLKLPEKAVFGDLLDEIDRQYGEKLPNSLWNHNRREFKSGILCVGEGRDLETRETTLKPGETISIVVHMAGG